MRAASWWIALLLVPLLAPAIARSSPLVLDAMDQPYPLNRCLTLPFEVIYLGSWCETTCPPDAPTRWCAHSATASQWHLWDGPEGPIYLGSRSTELVGLPLAEAAWARIDPVNRRLDVSLSASSGAGGLHVTWTPPADLPLDLIGAGMGAFRFEFEGMITPERPLHLSFLLQQAWSGAVLGWDVTAPGEVIIPFAAFAPFGGFDFRSVNWIELSISECEGDCAQPRGPRQFALGPITFVPFGPTAVGRSSWGLLKIRYR